MKKTTVALAMFCLPLGTHAQRALEVIPLRHASAEQVLPVLRPLLEELSR